MSIVLVIIGLIVGGVAVGVSLLHVAKIRQTISQIDQSKTAINTFKQNYNCLPGDCRRAVQFFGRHSSLGSDGLHSSSMELHGLQPPFKMEHATATGMSNITNGREPIKNAWQHLGAAGLVAGKYKGGQGAGSGSEITVPGIHHRWWPFQTKAFWVWILAKYHFYHSIWNASFLIWTNLNLRNQRLCLSARTGP